jgi:hypothetical protein
MSTIRQMWPQVHKVKPEIRQVTGGFTYKPDRTDDNLIYGTPKFVVDNRISSGEKGQGQLRLDQRTSPSLRTWRSASRERSRGLNAFPADSFMRQFPRCES